jgi:Helix-turn-helix domain
LRGTGIGPVLREARQQRGKSIQEASRETHIRPEYLQALERERFETLIGDVYIRGFLRSYSTYLGLDADSVLTVYNRTFGPPRPTLPEAAPGPVRSHRSVHPHQPGALRRHPPSWTFLILIAVGALVVLGAAGLLSKSRATPQSEPPPVRPSVDVLPQKVVVALFAKHDVAVVIHTDGRVAFDGVMREGRGLSYDASREVQVQLARGGQVEITVNGHRLGTPGTPDAPYSDSFSPLDYRRPPSTASPGR